MVTDTPVHDGAVTRWVFHMDLDQFIAAVEVLRRPELAGRPVVVGGDGDPSKRGVVSTANYEARAFGIHSAMPLRTAYKRCPDAVFLPVDAEAYLAASRTVMDTLRTFPAVVQEAGWDEAFLAVEAHDPETLARQIQRTVLERTSLWCSIGIGDNKLRAKIASGFAKPQGVFRLTRDNWTAVMGRRPTRELWGIGKKTSDKLAELRIATVEALANADEEALARRFGPNTGPWLRALATGEDASRVTDEPYVSKGHGREKTFQHDLTDPLEIGRRVGELARDLMEEIRDDGRPVVRVIVKVRFAPFFTSTHGIALPEPGLDAGAIEAAALDALGRFELDRPVRLLGVRVEFALRS
jgi:DNA polymerase-4